MNKVVLVLVDGMRPDSLPLCGSDLLLALANRGVSCMNAQTVYPSWTLPCHTSLFYSCLPQKHGVTENVWVPQREKSLCDLVYKAEKSASMVYDWEELRDLNRPNSLDFSYYRRLVGDMGEMMACEEQMTRIALEDLLICRRDFLFLYLGHADIAGHIYGWMSPEYLAAVQNASLMVERVRLALPKEYQLMVTADHGGHDLTHGTEQPVDMTIPLMLYGSLFEPGKTLPKASIMDIAPTIAEILGMKAPAGWEGHSLLHP